jgi:diguanylate cyclase (GGDEF)-like protein
MVDFQQGSAQNKTSASERVLPFCMPAILPVPYGDGLKMSAIAQFSGKPSADRSAGDGKIRFWTVTRRCIQIAAGVDLMFFFLFHALGSPILAWINVISIALYASAYLLLLRRLNRLAVMLIWIEVLGHASLGSMLLGWDSGFHYYLWMFVPAIFVSTNPRTAAVVVIGLAVFYLGMDWYSHAVGAMQPIESSALVGVRYFNIGVVFAMFSYLSYFYIRTVGNAQRQLDRLATTDSLTGLFNRRHAIHIIQHEMVQRARSKTPMSFVMADIDHFKEVNDRCGHEGGDAVLLAVSDVLKLAVRHHDVVARWGGEEFLIVLPDTELDIAAAIAERIRSEMMNMQCRYGGRSLSVTVTLGVSGLREEESVSEVVSRADRALYKGKALGRNRVEVDEEG